MQTVKSDLCSKCCSGFRALAIATLVILFFSGTFTFGQSFTVLHAFTAGADGRVPGELALDTAGNIYGTTQTGSAGLGGVFKMQLRNTSWTLTPIYNFTDRNGGQYPRGVVLGPDARLYGTTLTDGINFAGTVFSVAPPPSICHAVLCPWTATQLLLFDRTNGAQPLNADLVFDHDGNVYGTTNSGGDYIGGCPEAGCGVVYQVQRSSGQWAGFVLYQFGNGSDIDPFGGVVLDNAGNLYGTAFTLDNNGDVYKLAAGSWAHSEIHHFSSPSDGSLPVAGLLIDAGGNLYGTTTAGGANGGGTVFELSPSQGGWTFQVLYNFIGNAAGTLGPLTMDSAGNLYGATQRGGAGGVGNVFKLTKTNGSWGYTSLYDFTNHADGAYPTSKILIDAHGNLYGSAVAGGIFNTVCPNGCGVVFEITQ
jgi:uncharacterized repeat protein (TIGR03803 family)